MASALGFQFIDNYFDKPNQNWVQKMLNETNKAGGLNYKISNPYPSMPFSNYEGVYNNPIYGKVIVTKKNETLEISIGKNNLKLSLTHWDRDIFTLKWPIVDDTQSKVIFIQDYKGKISKMRMEYFANEGSGDFERLP